MPEHYYTETPHSTLAEKEFSYAVRGSVLRLTSVSGVFAFSSGIDRASELLIKCFSPSGNSILDMGCGYGAIGLFLKSLFPSQRIVLCDINARAVEYAVINAKKNDLDITAIKSDLFDELKYMCFDDIVTNPPIAAGKKLNTELITQSYDHLNNDGALWLVAFHNKGGSTLKEIMRSRFGNVEDAVKSGGIRVYKSIKA